ncbi:MAG: pyridoxal-phosphate dependent enzyme [Pseudomonadota bacterium]
MLNPEPSAAIELPTAVSVTGAAGRLAGRIHETPVMTSRSLNDMAGCELFFKCENLQRGGSFKIRGAMNAALLAAPDGPLVTHSSGNHGAALALAGRELDREVIVVVPAVTPQFKQDNVRRYGAELRHCGPTLDEREAMVADVLATGGTYVPPYDHANVIAGQGTMALELTRQVEGLDELWLPVGGGGMASGCALGAPAGCRVMGAEPELADDAYESLATHTRVPARPPVTVADGLRGALGELTFAVLDRYGLAIERVSEAEIVAAQALLLGCLKQVVEPSGAVAFAALLRRQRREPRTARVGVIVSGGNVDLLAADSG